MRFSDPADEIGKPGKRSVQLADAQVAEVDEAAGIVALEGDGSFAEAFGFFSVVGGLGVFVDDFSVDGDGDLFTFDFDVVFEPFAVLVAGLLEVLKAVNASGFAPVAVRGIDLKFVSLVRPAFGLIGGVDEDAGVGFFGGFDFALEFEVLEFGIAVFSVEKVGALSLHLDGSVFDGEGFGVFRIYLPALEGFAIEHFNPISGEGEGC